jgi:iron complex transport system permease protein
MDESRRRRGDAILLTCLALLTAGLFVASLAVGPVFLTPQEVLQGLAGTGSETARIIVADIRLPRALLALMIGATLGLSGAALQGLLRNPLAAPSLFGAPAAAAFGAVTVISLGLVDALSFALPFAAIAGALVSVALLILVAGPRASLLVLILAGLAISSLAGAGTALALNLAPNPFAALEIAFWLLGSLEDRSMRHVLIALPFMVAGAAFLIRDRRAFRALTLGEEAAASLGFSLTRVRLRVVLGVAAAVGAGVAVAGTIGFVGLVAPHAARSLVGRRHVRVVPVAVLLGAVLVCVADLLGRTVIAPAQLGAGLMTAVVGTPYFLYLLVRGRR